MGHTKSFHRIDLVDVDGQKGFSNLAPMRLYVWHKTHGIWAIGNT